MSLTHFSIQFVKRILPLSHPPTRKAIEFYSSRRFVSHPTVTSSSYVKCSRYSVISYWYMIPQRLFLYCLSSSGYYWRRNPWSIIYRLWIIYDSFCFVLASFCEMIGMVWCSQTRRAHLLLIISTPGIAGGALGKNQAICGAGFIVPDTFKDLPQVLQVNWAPCWAGSSQYLHGLQVGSGAWSHL